MANRKTELRKPSLPQMRRALGVMSQTLHLLPEEARASMLQVLQGVDPVLLESGCHAPGMLQMYRSLGVLRGGLHLLPEDVRDSMRQVLRTVKQNQVEKRLDVLQRMGVLHRQRQEVQR